MKKVLSLLLTLVLLTALVPAASIAEGKTFTLMVYMCGTDLESDGGCATADLKEMIKSGAKSGGNLTIYVQTGGTKKWATKGMTNREGERWLVSKDGLERVDSLGNIDMGSGDEFTGFLKYGIENYPADRYAVVLWDHGAGATDGVCYDEITDNSLNMAKIYQSLSVASKEANYRKLSFVGFDACLMADYEMALHLAPFADYMIASEETEPGDGWDYSKWLPMLAKDAGRDIEEVGKKIVDSFVQGVDTSYGDYGTLSVLNLNKLDPLRTAMEEMGETLTGEITGGNFNTISRLRQNVRAFGETDSDSSDMIDLSVFAKIYAQYDATGAQNLLSALSDAVVYSRFTNNLSDVTGLSVLVPYKTRDYASDYLQNYDTQNLMPKYTAFVKSLAEQMTSGNYTFSSGGVTQQSVQDATVDWFSQYATDTQTYYDTYQNLWGNTSGTGATSSPQATAASGSTGSSGSDSFSLDSFLNNLFDSGSNSFNDQALTSNNLWDSTADSTNTAVSSSSFQNLWGDQSQSASNATVEVTSGDQTYTVENPFANTTGDSAYTLQLTADDLQNLSYAESYLLQDVSDPGFECYVDLGYTQDVIVDWNQGKLYGLFDGTWPTLAGQMVCIYDQVANQNFVRSLIPVTLNGEKTYLMVVFDQEHPGGVVVGYTEGYNDAGQPVRGYEVLKEGDIVIPQYELMYWDDNDVQQSEPYEGDPITVGANGTIGFGYEAVESGSYKYGFCLNDVYGAYQFSDSTTLTY